MIHTPLSVNVLLWGVCIGKLSWDYVRQVSVFQFTEDYTKCPYDICPSTHKKGIDSAAAFFGRRGDLYQGLPEFIADSLPDKWDSSLFDQWMTDNNVSLMDSTPLLKLSYIGKRAMGALEFVPDYPEQTGLESLDMSSLANLASEVYIETGSKPFYLRKIA